MGLKGQNWSHPCPWRVIAVSLADYGFQVVWAAICRGWRGPRCWFHRLEAGPSTPKVLRGRGCRWPELHMTSTPVDVFPFLSIGRIFGRIQWQ